MKIPDLNSRVADVFPTHSNRHTMKVGVELELLSFDAHDASVVAIDRLRPAMSHPAVGFEPGGQVEMSLPCLDTLSALDRQVASVSSQVRADAAHVGARLLAMPMDPRPVTVVPLQLTSPRYLAMQRHFDQIGAAGRVMMRRTASTQFCFDWWPGAAGFEQWRLTQLVGPALAAVFATGDGSRLATWLEVDPSRTAFDARLLGPDPVAAYSEFAERAGRFVEPGAHLTTLFPPVRPRGNYLEIRYLDAQPQERVAAISTVFAALLYEDSARTSALTLLRNRDTTLAEDWRTSAADPRNAELLERGGRLIELALEAMRSAPRHYLPRNIESRARDLMPTTIAVAS